MGFPDISLQRQASINITLTLREVKITHEILTRVIVLF